MEIDKAKVDEFTLALLYLTTFKDKHGQREWKSHDWDVLDRLHASGNSNQEYIACIVPSRLPLLPHDQQQFSSRGPTLAAQMAAKLHNDKLKHRGDYVVRGDAMKVRSLRPSQCWR